MLRRYALLLVLVACAVLNLAPLASAQTKELGELRLLYVGTERPDEYATFLKEHVKEIQTISREEFQPNQAKGYDVVLLDWPQSEETRELRAQGTTPLGQRESWVKPTVLLGSAGLNLAVAWQMQGGSGCTCLDPVAYDLRDHEIFDRPFKINTAATVSILTPESFRDELEQSQIDVLPLVDDFEANWRAGWCTYSHSFSKNPDVEFFCGGVNDKTPQAAGLWRQGNFLHYGFQQSPAEMNENGRRMLLNSIAYIARFTDNPPIATTPSVFAGEISRPRTTPANWLNRVPEADRKPNNRSTNSFSLDYLGAVLEMMEPEARAQLAELQPFEQKIAWCQENAKYFYPKREHLLGVDEDLAHYEIAFDVPEFLSRVLEDLAADDETAVERARRLLERYVPCGPGTQSDAATWQQWYSANEPYLFALDTGDYRWYIDELAKRRGISSRELRGPARAQID